MGISKVLITGVSSGIGRALTKKLILNGHNVWGIARRKELLETLEIQVKNNSSLIVSSIDIAKTDSWSKLCFDLQREKFIPNIIIFNAAVNESDLNPLNPKLTKEIFNVNFFSIIIGVKYLLHFVKRGTQFIVISSLSALKGSGVEGIGYPASKAAISVAFESLQRKFGNKYSFKTIYFGPIAAGMGPFKKVLPVILSEEEAVEKIIKVMKSKQIIHYYPGSIFFTLKMIKFFPSNIYLDVLSKLETLHLKLKKR